MTNGECGGAVLRSFSNAFVVDMFYPRLLMSKKQPMFYVGFCRLCGTGPLGLRRCGSCGKVVVLCDECDAIWMSSDLSAKPYLAQGEELPCPECRGSLLRSPSRWATLADIEASSWLPLALEDGLFELHRGEAFAPAVREDKAPCDDDADDDCDDDCEEESVGEETWDEEADDEEDDVEGLDF